MNIFVKGKKSNGGVINETIALKKNPAYMLPNMKTDHFPFILSIFPPYLFWSKKDIKFTEENTHSLL